MISLLLYFTLLALSLTSLVLGQQHYIPVMTEFHSSMDLYNQYVKPGQPVVLAKILRDVQQEDLKVSNLASDSAWASVTVAEDGDAKRGTVRQLLKNGMSTFQWPIHANMKHMLNIVGPFQCKWFYAHLRSSEHVLGKNAQPETDEHHHHQLYCQIEGDTRNTLAKLDEKLNVELEEGDCLFIPGQSWTLYESKPMSSQLNHWLRITIDVTDPQPADCDGRKGMSLADRDWADEGHTVRPDKALIHFVNTFTMKGMKREEVMKKITSDGFFRPIKLPKWNEECDGIAQELFDKMDINQDGAVDKDDLGFQDLDLVTTLASHANNKKQDLAEISFDMRVDLAGALPMKYSTEEAGRLIYDSEQVVVKDMEKTKGGDDKKKIKDEL